MESSVINRAKYITHTGNGRAELVREAFPSISPEKHKVITNGYDEDDFKALPGVSANKIGSERSLNLINIGQIYVDAAFGQFLDGFKKALSSSTTPIDINLNLIDESHAEWESAIDEFPYRDHINILGFKPHKEALAIMMKADVLMLLLPEGDKRMRDKIIAGKTFELLRSGRPIFMVGWEGESTRIIERSGLGRFASCDDVNKISEVILEYYKMKLDGKLDPGPDWDYIKQYERRNLAGKLAALFDDAVAKR